MNENKTAKQIFRRARELAWYHAGREAFNSGKLLGDWPKVGEVGLSVINGKEVKVYPRIRYVARDAWQLGWNNAYHVQDNDMNARTPPTSEELIKLATESLMGLPQRLAKIIDTLAPMRLRSLPGHFGMRDRAEVNSLVKKWAEQGVVKLTGTGKRGNPFIVRKSPMPKEEVAQ